jgi:hypothetical protein
MVEKLNEHFDVSYIGMPYPTKETNDLKNTHTLKLHQCTDEYNEVVFKLNESIS